MLRRYYICLLLLLSSFRLLGQEGTVFNINNYNGLSSNHVYCTLVDKLGYLWISTPDGVFRYNGYSFTKYDYSDGLPNIDVWNMYEDSQGKIWLLSIADGIGYIQNNKFVRLQNELARYNKIYPKDFTEVDSLVMFRHTINRSDTTISVIVANNTNYTELKMPFHILSSNINLFRDFICYSTDSTISLYPVRYFINNGTLPNASYKTTHHLKLKTAYSPYTIIGTFANKYLYYSIPKSQLIKLYDIYKNKMFEFAVNNINKGNETLIHFYPLRYKAVALTNYSAIVIDSNLQIAKIQPYNSFFETNEDTLVNTTYYIEDNFWGEILSTSDNGLYIKKGTPLFIKTEVNLNGFELKGFKNLSTGYWWNEQNNTLLAVKNNSVIARHVMKDIFRIKKIVPHNEHQSFLFSDKNFKILQDNGQHINFLQRIDTVVYDGNTLTIDSFLGNLFFSATDCIVKNQQAFYLNLGGYLGLIDARINKNKLYCSVINNERNQNIVNYSYSNKIICYNKERVWLYDIGTQKEITITRQQLKALGINSIQEILTDSLGNIIIKDYDKLYLYNSHIKKPKRLLKNYNLKGSVVNIQKGVLKVAGSFGVYQSVISSDGKLASPQVFSNTKNIYYGFVYDAQFNDSSVLLNTDKGTYIVNTSSRLQFNNAGEHYKIILAYENKLHELNTGDTIKINQTTSYLNTDVINPTGTGQLKTEYTINNSSYIQSGEQIILPKLTAGGYNNITIRVSDNSWNSIPLSFHVYIVPYWWQTPNAKKTIYAIVLLSILGLAYLISIITRRVVNKNNDRRNQRRELELKSIYSQINPHFIFNSLSTAQYFVKKNKNKEAYDHINQFSDLLRAYIKSSRNKYISIADEIENLENYLELQLTRFEERFKYSISVDNVIDANTEMLPSLLLQPLVENALNHGIFHLDGIGQLNISFKKNPNNNNVLICVVDDNGIGREKSKELRKSSLIQKADSYGTILIKELIDTFNKYEQIHIDINYIDKKPPQTGTTVIISIKK